MSDKIVQARVLARRSPTATEPPELRFGEFFYADGEDGALFIGRSDGTIKKLVPSEAPSDPIEVGVIHVGTLPPEDSTKLLWLQTDDDGALVDRWQRTPTNRWVSEAVYTESAFIFEVKRNLAYPKPNPCGGEELWIERFTASAVTSDNMRAGDYIDFKLKLVNIAQQKTTLFFHRLEGKSRGQMFSASEYVGHMAIAEQALGLWLSLERRGQTKLKTMSMSVELRRVYAPSN